MSNDHRYRFYVALDGNGVDGFEGMAGVCLFLYDPVDGSYAYKIQYFQGAAAGHATSVSPNGKVGFLGNIGQHLLFYDAETLTELERISTLRFEPTDTTMRGSTHVVWLDDDEFIVCIGDYLYRFELSNLGAGERLAPHKVSLPHAMKRSRSGRYICYGSMDNPSRGVEAKEVGIFDLQSGEARRVGLPTTCWHLACHTQNDVFYPVSFRVLPQEGGDYHQWAIAFFKEYVFEVDAESGEVQRHWTTSRETPAHINSDVAVSDREVIFCNGASQSIVFVDLGDLSTTRIIDERPNFLRLVRASRQLATQVYDAFARGSVYSSNRHFFAAMRVNRFTLLDSVYATQISADQSLLFTANRGLNHITIYDYPSNELRLRVDMPDLQGYVPSLTPLEDPRLGFHHGFLISPRAEAPVVSENLAAGAEASPDGGRDVRAHE